METGGKDVARAAEEEVLKRNTDCVYFLASPLTCKKGVECEYRHSEGARVNPRDCWFWLNGNCLNPKCSFRHPPLDGLIGTPTTITGPTLPGQPKISTQPSSTHFSAAHNPNKQGVPCYYYQRGGCLKGDRCPYLHGTTPIPNPVSQQVPKVSAPVSAPAQSMKKTSWSLDKISQQNIPKETSHQPIEIVTPVKPPARADTPAANGMPMKETLHSHVEFPSIPGTGASLGDVNAPSMSQSRQSEPLDDDFQNEGEGNGYFRESSPGFDVLVDDENEDPGYFCEEDELEGAPGHDGRRLNPAADFEYHPSSDYETADKFRGVSFVDADEYDHHVRGNDYYTPEHHGAFPERELELPSVSDRRRSRREDNVSRIDGSDLRHRLLKKRRVNASRSGVSPDRHEVQRNDDHYFEEHRYRAHGRRIDPRNAPRDIPIGKRLQGRLSLPVRIPADNSSDRYSEREVVLGRNLGRSSPIRPTNYHARGLHDRINMRSSERYRSDEKNIVAPSTRSDELVIQDFAGPKRLSELKSRKVPHIFYHRSIGCNDNSISRDQRSMRMGKALGHQEADSVPFEGPQPLSVILKRKREASAVNSAPSGNEELNGKGGEDLTFSYATSAAVTISSQIHRSSESARKNDRAVDPEAAVVDIEDDDSTVDVIDQPSAKEGANGTEEDALEYNDEGEYGDYEHGDEEYYQENEDAEYEPEGGEDMYEEEAEGNEEGDEDYAQKLAMCN